jgi:para-nitrobenzyl esterase
LRLIGLSATHATELLAVFYQPRHPFTRLITLLGGRRRLARVAHRMQGHWLHFARYGTPGDGWPSYEREERQTLVFDSSDRVEKDPNADRRRAWTGYRNYR